MEKSGLSPGFWRIYRLGDRTIVPNWILFCSRSDSVVLQRTRERTTCLAVNDAWEFPYAIALGSPIPLVVREIRPL